MTKNDPTLDVRKYNQYAWDRQVDKKNPFTIPVSSDVIAAARQGEFSVSINRNQTCTALPGFRHSKGWTCSVWLAVVANRDPSSRPWELMLPFLTIHLPNWLTTVW